MPKSFTLTLYTYSRPEVYAGDATGRTQWICEAARIPANFECRAYVPFGAVLGRASNEAAAIDDWKFRQSHESDAKDYALKLIVLPKPENTY